MKVKVVLQAYIDLNIYHPYDMCYDEYNETISINLKIVHCFSKIFAKDFYKFLASGISHEVLHHILYIEHGEKVCEQFDNIAADCEDYGMW